MNTQDYYNITADENGWRTLPNGNKIKLGISVIIGYGAKIGNYTIVGNNTIIGDGVIVSNKRFYVAGLGVI